MADHWLLNSDSDAADALLGGKAASLRQQQRAGLPVPAWFVVSPEAWVAYRDTGTLPAGEWVLAAQTLAGENGLLAVRSSAVDEDGKDNSFAGQLDTFLSVPPSDVPDKIKAVWQSAFSDRIRAYRAERGLGELQPSAVLIQRMVDAEAAGVAFSADPVSGRRGIALVSAVIGLGTRLVSGEGEADLWRVDRQGRIIERIIEKKAIIHRSSAGSGEGVQDEQNSNPLKPSLTDPEAIQVAALARRCAQIAGAPQDIEWALSGGEIFLLQARPITTLKAIPDPDAQPALWDNSNIAESYGGITTPLTYSFARRAYEEVYRQFCRLMSVNESRIAANAETFRGMIGFIQGRVYYNLLNWYRVLAMLPGYQVNQEFMEQMMGVKDGLPQELAATIPSATAWARFRDALDFGRSVFGLLRNHWTIERQIKMFYQRLDDALAETEIPFVDRRLDEWAAEYQSLERTLLTRWDAPLINDFLAMIFFGLLRKLCVSWCQDPDGTLQNDLVSGDGGVISAEPALRVRAMAEAIRSDASFSKQLREGSLPDILKSAEANSDFWKMFTDYLSKFGDRCLEELKLESPTLRDDPLPLFRAIGHMAARAPEEKKDSSSGRRKDAEVRVSRAIGINFSKKILFGWVLSNARARVRDRENLRFERTRLFGRVRKIFVEMGRGFHASNALDDPRDIFFLELNEILGFVSGTTACNDLNALVKVRKIENEKHRTLPPPPDRFRTRGCVGSAIFEAVLSASGKEDDRGSGDQLRRGSGCCAGVVRGRARVVRDPRGVDLPAGTILVAERTDPGWIMIFPAAAGLVVERGSLLSHSAIVARELGLPAVVGVPGCTAWIKDGDLIELDGSLGTVRKVES